MSAILLLSMKKPSKHKQFIEAAFVSIVLGVLLFSIAPRSQAVFTSPTASLIAPPGSSLGGSSLFTQSQASSISIQPTAAPTTASTPTSQSSAKSSSSQSGSGAVTSAVGSLLGMIPFGGQITQVIRCNDGSLWMAIKPAGQSPTPQIWTPSTKTYMYGPPMRPGQWVLGLDASPGVCYVGKFAIYGTTMLMVGDSQ